MFHLWISFFISAAPWQMLRACTARVPFFIMFAFVCVCVCAKERTPLDSRVWTRNVAAFVCSAATFGDWIVLCSQWKLQFYRRTAEIMEMKPCIKRWWEIFVGTGCRSRHDVGRSLRLCLQTGVLRSRVVQENETNWKAQE